MVEGLRERVWAPGSAVLWRPAREGRPPPRAPRIWPHPARWSRHRHHDGFRETDIRERRRRPCPRYDAGADAARAQRRLPSRAGRPRRRCPVDGAVRADRHREARGAGDAGRKADRGQDRHRARFDPVGLPGRLGCVRRRRGIPARAGATRPRSAPGHRRSNRRRRVRDGPQPDPRRWARQPRAGRPHCRRRRQSPVGGNGTQRRLEWTRYCWRSEVCARS